MKNEKILKTARVAYETVRAYLNEQDKIERKPFKELTHEDANTLCQAVKLLVDNPRTSAASVHEAWIDKMIVAGWTYGREFNEDMMTDPQMVSYRELPPIRRKNDRLFHTVVKIGVI